ncbi:hypothetical protein [Pontibacillus sp. ALD_SL1]|nr:hypothetical protein [Pontibacillus sp. ALD_SL1]
MRERNHTIIQLEEKKKLTVADLLEDFQKARGKSLADDKTLLQEL